MKSAAPASRLATLDLMRALAAIAVYLSHVLSVSALTLGIPEFVEGVGVETFYFVSGFGIALTILRAREWNLTHFFKRRILRILPAYYVSILLLVGLVQSDFLLSPHGLGIIAQHLVMLHGFNAEFRGAINGVYWMLGNVVWFYLLAGLLAPVLRSRAFPALIVAGILLALVWRAVVFLSIPPTQDLLRHYWSTQLPGVLDSYMAGMVCAWLYARGRLVAGNRPWLKAAAGNIIAAGILIFIVSLVIRRMSAPSLPFYVSWRLLLAVGLGGITAGMAALEPLPRFNRLLRFSGLAGLSKISYSFFLYHLPVIVAFNHFVSGSTITNQWLLFGIMTAAVILVAAGSYLLVEQRALRINEIPLIQWRRSNPHEYARQDKRTAPETH